MMGLQVSAEKFIERYIIVSKEHSVNGNKPFELIVLETHYGILESSSLEDIRVVAKKRLYEDLEKRDYKGVQILLENSFVDKAQEKEKIFEALVNQASERKDKHTLDSLFKGDTVSTEDGLLSALMQSLELNQEIKLRGLLTVAHKASHSYTDVLMNVMQVEYKIDDVILSRTKFGVTAAHLAARSGSLAYLQAIIEKEKSLLDTKTNIGGTVLHYAVRGGHLNVVDWLVSEDRVLLNTKTNHGETVLHVAAMAGHLNVVDWLVSEDRGLLNTKCNDGTTVLQHAVIGGHLNVIGRLVSEDRGLLNTKSNDGSTVLHYAVRGGHLNVVDWLVSEDRGLLNTKSNNGVTVLHMAASGGYLNVVDWLVSEDRGLLNTKSNNGVTVLHYAARNGHLNVVDWLVEEDKKNDERKLLGRISCGRTALTYAAEKGHEKVVELLSAYPKELEAVRSVSAYSENIKKIIQTSRSQGTKRKDENEGQKGTPKKRKNRRDAAGGGLKTMGSEAPAGGLMQSPEGVFKVKRDPDESRKKPINVKLEFTYPEDHWTDYKLKKLVQEVELCRPEEERGQDNCEKMAWRVFKALLGQPASLRCPIACEGINYTMPSCQKSVGCMHLTKNIENAYDGYISDQEEIDVSGTDIAYNLDTDEVLTYHVCARELNHVMRTINPRADSVQPFGLLGVERAAGWHQLVWLKRSEDDVVLIDMNHESHKYSLLRDFSKNYSDVKKCSLLRFNKDCPVVMSPGMRPSM